MKVDIKNLKYIVLMLFFSVLVIGISNTASAATDVKVDIEGYQINTATEGYRVIYSIDDTGSSVFSCGLIYGLKDYATQTDMVINSSNKTVYSFNASSNGKVSASLSATGNDCYVMTMDFIKNAKFYSSKIMVRAFALLWDGTVVYSDISTASVFDIADVLYKGSMMTSLDRHDYLYNNILKVVDINYAPVSYTGSITNYYPVTTKTQETTVAPTTQSPTTQTPTTQATTTVTPTTTQSPTTQAPTTQAPTIVTPTTTQAPTTAEEQTTAKAPEGQKCTDKPAAITIAHDNYEKKYSYNITGTIWYGNNATAYTLYEKKGKTGTYKIVESGTVIDDTPNVQAFTFNIKEKTLPGTYWYKLVLANQYGSTESNELSVTVGSGTSSPITVETIDADEVSNQYITSQGTFTYAIEDSSVDNPTYTVVSSNTSVVKASIVNGTSLKLEAIAGGRTGIKITETSSGVSRYFGIRVRDNDGTLSVLPKSYVSIGQVSEDSTADLKFLQSTSNDDTNKRLDVRYIYINGGPIDGWQSWNSDDPEKRVRSYIIESLKLGIVPYFVYYNIPDGSESYDVDKNHINDTTYMEAYYKDLVFFLETCDKYDNGESVGIILEPDFLGYMMQNDNADPNLISAKGVEAAYTSGVLTKGVDPDFANTVTGLVESINYIISTKYPTAHFGWQFNTWSYSNGVPGTGLMHATETMGYTKGLEFIKNAATATAQYYMKAGILKYDADFISIDKYGLDGAYETGAAANPGQSRWLWNADLWNNYLYYTKTLHETTGFDVTLWQIPVGHLNSSTSINPYTGNVFTDLNNTEQHYEDSAATYFFGDTFNPGSDIRGQYFSTNEWNDSKVSTNNNTITYGEHISNAKEAGVTCILFGAGVGSSTDAVGNPPTDDYFWISKAQQYFNSLNK